MKVNACFFLFFLMFISIVNCVQENERQGGCGESLLRENDKKKKSEGILLVGNVDEIVKILTDVLKAKMELLERVATVLSDSLNRFQEEQSENGFVHLSLPVPDGKEKSGDGKEESGDDKEESSNVEKRRLQSNNNIISTALKRRRLQSDNNAEEASRKLEELIDEVTEAIQKLSTYVENEKLPMKKQEGFVDITRADVDDFKRTVDQWLNQSIVSLRRELDFLKQMLGNMQDRVQRSKEAVARQIVTTGPSSSSSGAAES